eukprot:UN32517
MEGFLATLNKKALVICNPFSGSGEGKLIYDRVVSPMLDQAGLEYKTMFTERANHGVDMGKNFDMESFDFIFIISGDGVLHELFQGWAVKYDTKEQYNKFLQKVKIGQVPAGTGNSLACSVAMEEFKTMDLDAFRHFERML